MAGSWMPHTVPALWGLNALAAVFGSALSAAVAIAFGFQAVLLLGAALYLTAALLLAFAGPSLPDRPAA